MQLFTATAEAQSAPQVDFNLGAPPSNASAAPGGTAAPVAPGATPPAQ
jgi:LemA protein